ncbi:MAG TPA: ATP-dependent helicase C-terminal domain-containing protein, partial [Tepidisphaeraceae bacterium]|nr:ATP-dependent helicase C-terminal domain-containing protein [Tepidisphaeraceae bacterium]
QVAGAVRQVLDPSRQADAGDVLCFLPGAEEIRRTARALASLAGAADLLVLPLHGSLPPEEQRLALRPPPPGKRKVVLATNIAETSLTIGGVRTVIDSGLARVAGYDPRRGLDRLDVRRISKASAAQRAGRAGRTAPGRCVRLWTAKEQNDLPDFELPEVRRVDLAGTVLTLHAWGKPDARTFDWYEPPDERALAAAERLLFLLGAVDAESNAKLTPLGRRMAQVPAHPRLARLLIDAADAGLSREGATLAALLSEKDVATYAGGGPMRDRVPTTQADSDVPLRVAMLERAERERFHPALRDNGIDPEAARQVARVRDELLRLTPSTRTRGEGRAPGGATEGKTPLPRPLPEYGAREDAFSKLVLAAYPDRVCKRRESDPSAGTMVGGSGVRLAAESAVRRHALFVAVDARADDRSGRNEALVRVASGIEPQWLEELFPASVTRVRELSFDDVRQRVVGRLVTRYLDLVLSDDANQPVDPQQAGAVLGEALAPRAREIVQSDESAARLLARVALLREHLREPPWPSADPADLVREAAAGVRSVDELRARLADAVRAQLPYPLDRLLEQHAPDAIEVPTGNHIKLDYAGPAPVLAVRLQELFGLADTPRVAAGRVPVVLHLLGPNYRPVQVTSDLRSFWANTYPQVRKDLRARYPKHSWPENPMAATPEARGGRRRS